MLNKYLKILSIITVSSLLFIALFYFDNKYDQRSLQASNGLLILSKEDFKEDTAYFLSRGWSFYPDVLLSPKDFQNGDPDLYMKDVTIGENAIFDPYGKGTYVLRIKLPKEDTYALDIPEIFSAYTIYINDEMMLSIGNPDPDNYEAKTANRLITFKQSGTITIIINVSNYSHFYSGMVYPPAFGNPTSLNYVRGIHLGINLINITIILITATFSLYFCIVRKQTNTFIFFLLSLTSLGFISYPIIHTMFVTSIFPWYFFEVTSGYLAMLLIVVLHNRLCYINKKTALISMISTGLFCLLIAFYCLNSGNLDLNIIALFSDLIFLFKILLAAYLLITSYYAVKNDYLQANLLFYSEIFFACACIWDRVFINYEPIYGIRFIEGGILVVIYSIAILLWKNIIKTYTLNLAFIEEYRQITKQLDIQQAYTLKIKEVIDEKRRLIHDFKHHLCVIDNMAKQTNPKNIIEYISNTNEFIDTSNNFNIIFTNNVAVDALLQYYAELCQKQNIKLSLNLSLPEASPLNDVEWCIILGNLLENSITACFQQKDTHKFIQINSKETEHTFYLVFKNSYNGKIRKIGIKYLSLKDDPKQHGIGLESIKSIIYKYQGTVDIYADNKLFNVGITIPISSKLSK